MNCDGVRDLLSAYLDGELSPGELLRVEQHLRRCHACADEVDSLRQTVALVASLEEVELPVGFHAQLHDRLVALGPPAAAVRRVGSAQSRQRQLRRWAVPAAAAAAVFAVGLTAYSTLSSPALPGGLTATSTFPPSLVAEKSQQDTTTKTVTPDPAKPNDVAQNTLPDTSTTGKDTTGTAQPGTSQQPGTKQNDQTFVENIGNTSNRDGGSGTAAIPTKSTTPTPTLTVVQYAAVVSVAKDDAKVATLKSENALSQEVNGGLMITLPDHNSFEALIARVKELFPTAQVSYQNRDLSADVAAADEKLTVLRADLEQLKKQPHADTEEVARRTEEIARTQEDRNLLVKQAETATVTLTFQTAAQ